MGKNYAHLTAARGVAANSAPSVLISKNVFVYSGASVCVLDLHSYGVHWMAIAVYSPTAIHLNRLYFGS